jgi:glycosyltransferase involved in cell wall biosynthesis
MREAAKRRGDPARCAGAGDNRPIVSEVVILSCDRVGGWRPSTGGDSIGLTEALAAAAPADVVLLSDDCTAEDVWLEGLSEAAYSDERVATATAMSWDSPTPDGAAATVRERSLRLRPRLPGMSGCCVYVRRSALELAGPPDPSFTPGAGEERGFSESCIRLGLCHVLADDVLVTRRTAINGLPRDELDLRSEGDQLGPLGRTLSHTRRVLMGLSVVIDGRVLTGPVTGTHVHLLELIGALARTGEVRLAVLAPDAPNDYARATLSSVKCVTRAQASELDADVVHRPWQVTNPGDLTLLASLGERLIVTQQDLISYNNPFYFRDRSEWEAYRRLTRLTLSVADHVVFFSAHAREDALRAELVDPTRTTVVRIGVDHADAGEPPEPRMPAGAVALPAGAQALLCIGTDYHHKNRVFALRVLDQLQRRHRWPGYLVFVGPHVQHGSSRADEREFLERQPGVAGRVIDLGAVSEGEKDWLFGRANLVLYPTVDEGFGLVPFEAAEHGVPCMWAPGTALDDLLPPAAGGIVGWDAPAGADRALELLSTDDARAAAVAAVTAAAAGLTWDATARGLLEVYAATCDAPPTGAGALERQHGVTSGGLTEDAMRLVGPGGALPADVERPLLALATNPRFGKPVFAVLKSAYRAGFWLRRRHSRR